MEFVYTVEVERGQTVKFTQRGDIIQGAGTWRALPAFVRERISPDLATLWQSLENGFIYSFTVQRGPLPEEPSQ